MRIFAITWFFLLTCFFNDENLAANCYGANPCQCSLTSIICNNTNVDEIPLFPAYSGITSIVISNNHLETFLISSQYTSVTSLVLCHNQMNQIFLSNFDLPNVKRLLLNNNNASYIHTNCTNMKNTLQIFSATDNYITTRYLPNFAEFIQLYHIDFSSNLLIGINDQIFPSVLQFLNLFNNSIISFNNLRLKSLKMLTHLNISYNHLNDLDFSNLPLSLKLLDVSYNNIETIADYVSNDQKDPLAFHDLEKIFLQGNNIKIICECKINLIIPISYSLLINEIEYCFNNTSLVANITREWNSFGYICTNTKIMDYIFTTSIIVSVILVPLSYILSKVIRYIENKISEHQENV